MTPEEAAMAIIGKLSPCPPPGYTGQWGYWRAFVLQPEIVAAILAERERAAKVIDERFGGPTELAAAIREEPSDDGPSQL